MNSRLVILLIAAVIVGHLGVRLLSVVRKARRRPRGAIHQGSLFARMMAVYLFLLAASVAEGLMHPQFHVETCLVGLVLYFGAMLLQWKAFADLGAAYSPDIEVRQEQPLVQKGLYAWVRHPILVAGVLETTGMALSLNAPCTALLTLAVFVPVLYQRWQEEEKALTAHFGDAYLAYKSRVGAFIPRGAR